MKALIVSVVLLALLSFPSCTAVSQPVTLNTTTTTLPSGNLEDDMVLIPLSPIPSGVPEGSSINQTQQIYDDIIPTPGGYAYRANVHEQGVSDRWPPVFTTTVKLDNSISLEYRKIIETEPGQVRNVIISAYNLPDPMDYHEMEVLSGPLPEGIKLGNYHTGGRPGLAQAVFAIYISPDAAIGLHELPISVIFNGQSLAGLKCSIYVCETVAYLPVFYPPDIPETAVRISFDFSLPEVNDSLAPDILAYIPGIGGLDYSADIPQSGKTYIPLRIEYATLAFGSTVIGVTYRKDIETGAGEIRYNFFDVAKADGSPVITDKFYFYAENVPEGITFTQGISDERSGYLLVIYVHDDIQTGLYTFNIGIVINGKDYGTLPCNINVIQ